MVHCSPFKIMYTIKLRGEMTVGPDLESYPDVSPGRHPGSTFHCDEDAGRR